MVMLRLCYGYAMALAVVPLDIANIHIHIEHIERSHAIDRPAEPFGRVGRTSAVLSSALQSSPLCSQCCHAINEEMR